MESPERPDPTRPLDRRGLLKRAMMAGAAGFAALAAGGVLGPLKAKAGTCTTPMYPRDLGGGTFTNRNYVIEIPRNWLPPRYSIYYQGRQMNLGNPQCIFEGRYRWGVSTGWAYLNPGWRNSSNWRFYYECGWRA